MNALSHYNNISNNGSFDINAWQYTGEITQGPKSHRGFFKAVEATSVGTRRFPQGSIIRLASSIKYCAAEAAIIFAKAHLSIELSWTNSSDDYGKVFATLPGSCRC
jgi:uncharacterized SAM-dependent methyltransferase